MKRREFVGVLVGAAVWLIIKGPQHFHTAFAKLLLAIFAVLIVTMPTNAQPLTKIPRLCFLTFDRGTAQSPSRRFEPFFKRLQELGYLHGQTIAIDYLSTEDRLEGFPALAAECLRLKADVIAVTTTPGAIAAKSATQTIPIIMLPLGDPIGTGLVNSIARPEGNLTGMTTMATELAPRRLELLKNAIPSISRVLVLSYSTDPIGVLQVKSLEAAAPSLGLTLLIQEIRNVNDLSSAFDVAAREGANALLATTASIFNVNRARVTELAAIYKLPAMYPYSIMVSEAGGLMAYDINEPDLHWHAAGYVDSILKGAKPSDLPIHRPTNPRFVINLKTAKTLGLEIPPSLLARADEVIE